LKLLAAEALVAVFVRIANEPLEQPFLRLLNLVGRDMTVLVRVEPVKQTARLLGRERSARQDKRRSYAGDAHDDLSQNMRFGP
jgi:hypothetical protein